MRTIDLRSVPRDREARIAFEPDETHVEVLFLDPDGGENAIILPTVWYDAEEHHGVLALLQRADYDVSVDQWSATMTSLTKPVSRRTDLIMDRRVSARARDQVTVTLYPDHTIGFRPYRARAKSEVRISMRTAYLIALREAEKQKKLDRRLHVVARGARKLVSRGLLATEQGRKS
mgnify:CR=1 FL=1